MNALGVARFVFPQLLARLAEAVAQDGAHQVASRLMAECAPSLGTADLHALAQVLPALGNECSIQLAVRVKETHT